jgi:exodeoxyribonuclease V gamma subunit
MVSRALGQSLSTPTSYIKRETPSTPLMPSLLQYRSNRLNVLVEPLAQLLVEPSASPLEPEVIVVPSLGMRRWLALEIARINGVCANVEFPFLGDFMASIPPELALPDLPQQRIPPEEVVWVIHRLLPALLQKKKFAAVAHYLADSNPLKTFQLCQRIAHLFDQYVVYRPEMIREWQTGKKTAAGDEAWQQILWRELANDPALVDWRKNRAASNHSARSLSLPPRLFVFGVTSIPPLYLEQLFALAGTRPIHLFLLEPSSEYHGDDLTPKQRAKRGITEGEAPTGNPLLTSMGRAQSQLTEQLIDTDERRPGVLVDKAEKFNAPKKQTLLGILQSDIFAALNRGTAINGHEQRVEKYCVSADDDSLRIHSCHSPMREVEVLYDQLLRLFEKDPTLRPREILVLSPEIEKYSPLIRAVFEYPEVASRKIPYRVSDRHPRSESIVADSFLQMLGLATSRCTAEQVFALVSSPLVAQRFRFSEDDLAQIRTWIQETGVCWGIDAAQRKGFGLPATHANTWRFGLDRMLLGYAMRGQNARLFDHILPYDEIEGDGGEVLGRFISATQKIFDFITNSQTALPLKDWAPLLRQAVDHLFESEDEDHIRDLWFLRRTFSGFEALADELSLCQAIALPVLRTHLEALLGTMRQRGGFLTGEVTFSALKPGRSIPARVILLLGMNDDIFPRRPQPAQFDLLDRRRLGDSSPREDDRYAFLETLCAATDYLHISYIGRSIVHNEPIPPSIVVNELLDYLDQAFDFGAVTTACKQITIEHPLQAFSPNYFDGSEQRLFSYSTANAAAATSLISQPSSLGSPSFIKPPLTALTEMERAITLKQLIDFLTDPARSLFRARFRFDLKHYDDAWADDEPIELDALEKYHIRQELLREYVDEGRSNLDVFIARGSAAPGIAGQLQLSSLNREAESFYLQIRNTVAQKRGEPVAIDLTLAQFSLSGLIESIYGPNTMHYRCANLSVRDWLQAWVEHLARSASSGNAAFRTVLIGKDQAVSWSPVPNASQMLDNLCEFYWRGLHERLPFFPKSALEFVKAEQAGKRDPLYHARLKWNGGYNIEGEHEQPEIRRLFPTGHPLDHEFEDIARLVWGPLLQNAQSRGLS